MSHTLLGKLSETPFPLLLFALYSERTSGCLEILQGKTQKRVYLDKGQVVFASSKDRNDRFGEMLVRRGILRLRDYCGASQRLEKGKRFGTVLVEMGILTPHQLVWAVKEQVQEIVFSLFLANSGNYSLKDEGGLEEEVITLNINTPELIKRGIGRMDRLDWILDYFENLDVPFLLSESSAEIEAVLTLTESEKEIVDGFATPRKILDMTGRGDLSDFDVIKLVWCLFVLNILVRAPEAQPERAAAVQKSAEQPAAPDSPPPVAESPEATVPEKDETDWAFLEPPPGSQQAESQPEFIDGPAAPEAAGQLEFIDEPAVPAVDHGLSPPASSIAGEPAPDDEFTLVEPGWEGPEMREARAVPDENPSDTMADAAMDALADIAPDGLEISGDDLRAIGGEEAAGSREEIFSEAMAAEYLGALASVSAALKPELGAAAFSFLSQAFEKHKFQASEGEIPEIKLLPDLRWSGRIESAGQALFVRGLLESVRGQIVALLPGKAAEVVSDICEKLEGGR